MDVLQFFALLIILMIILPLFRVAKGPTLFDRILGIQTISTKAIILILIIGLLFHRFDMFIDIALAYAMINFIGTLALSKYLGTSKGSLQ